MSAGFWVGWPRPLRLYGERGRSLILVAVFSPCFLIVDETKIGDRG
jgi:hypothetical protein